jgi:hypothetical protein
MRAIIRPQCCERVRSGAITWLEIVSDQYGWIINARQFPEESMETFKHIKFCPYCGKALPENPYTGD